MSVRPNVPSILNHISLIEGEFIMILRIQRNYYYYLPRGTSVMEMIILLSVVSAIIQVQLTTLLPMIITWGVLIGIIIIISKMGRWKLILMTSVTVPRLLRVR